MAKSKRPFTVNQIVKAQISYPPSVIAGNYYRVKAVCAAKSFSGWMVEVIGWGQASRRTTEILDSGYFVRPNVVPPENFRSLAA